MIYEYSKNTGIFYMHDWYEYSYKYVSLTHPLSNHYTCIIHLLWFGAPDSSPHI